MRQTASEIRAASALQHQDALAHIAATTARAARPHRASLRAAAGKRHSQADQDLLDAAATHVQAAATHLGNVGAVPADIDEEDPYQGSEKLSANESYKRTLTRTFANLRAASRLSEAEIAARPPEIRNLEALDDVPTAWDAALENRQPTQHDITPDMDPNYDPATGVPADGYKLAMALRHLQQEDAAERTPTVRAASARSPKTIVTNGVPDGYATAIARRNAS
jgi:hypothetical protein